MGDLRFTTGALLNLGNRAQTLTSSSELTGYEVGNAFDPTTDKPYIAAEGASNVTINVDLAQDSKGDFESWTGGVPDGWTDESTGSGTIGEEATEIGSGSKGLKLLPGAAGVAKVRRRYTVAAGEVLRLVAMGAVSSSTVRIRIYDPVLRRWWTGTAWQDTETDALTFANATPLVSGAVSITMPKFASSFLDQVPLDVYALANSTNGTAYLDSLFLYSCWDVITFHGHNIDAGAPITITGSDDGSSYSAPTFATAAAVRQPAFYARTSSQQTTRYVRILIGGTNVEQLNACRMVVGQSRRATRESDSDSADAISWQDDLQIQWTPAQKRFVTPAGVQRIYRLASRMPRKLSLVFKTVDRAQFQAIAEELYDRANAGEHAVLIIPDDAQPDVIYGRVTENPLSSTMPALTQTRSFNVEILEDAFSTVGR